MTKDSVVLLTIGVSGLAIGKFIGHFNTKKAYQKAYDKGMSEGCSYWQGRLDQLHDDTEYLENN